MCAAKLNVTFSRLSQELFLIISEGNVLLTAEDDGVSLRQVLGRHLVLPRGPRPLVSVRSVSPSSSQIFRKWGAKNFTIRIFSNVL